MQFYIRTVTSSSEIEMHDIYRTIILFVILYRRVTWSLTLKEEQ